MDKEELRKILKIDDKKLQISDIQKRMTESGFWNDYEEAQKFSKRLNALTNIVAKFESAETLEQVAELEDEALYGGEYDSSDVAISVHAGAGGTEAQDWAEMLMRMLMKFAENKGYVVKLLDTSFGEEAGIKSATFEVSGDNAYGNFKSEAGVHRLVRISPYDADKARHTSFALVEVIPELDEIKDVELDDKELKIDTFHASGHGGQSVNTTNSAIRITHLPTKTVVTVQNERSQLQNKETALKILKAKILVKRLEAKKAEEEKLKGGHVSAEWGNQIRSYVLQPYQLVKDHRTDYEETNPDSVLNGNLAGFVKAYLRKLQT